MKESCDIALKDYVEKHASNQRIYAKTDAFTVLNDNLKTYCSIQIVKSEKNSLPMQVANSYFEWLSSASKSLIKTAFEENTYKLYFFLFKKPLLTLTLSENTEQQAIFSVSGGLLAKRNQKGSFTFKRLKEKESHYVIALEEFEPSLPWQLYRITQAPLHEVVMRNFQKTKRGDS